VNIMSHGWLVSTGSLCRHRCSCQLCGRLRWAQRHSTLLSIIGLFLILCAFLLVNSLQRRYRMQTHQLYCKPDAIAVILEDSKLLHEFDIRFVETYACTYGFQCHKTKLGYNDCMTPPPPRA